MNLLSYIKVFTVYCHEDGKHNIVCEEDELLNVAETIYRRREAGGDIRPRTMLYEFFATVRACVEDDPSCPESEMTYLDFPRFYYWNKTTHRWVKRVRESRRIVVRMGTVPSSMRELLVILSFILFDISTFSQFVVSSR